MILIIRLTSVAVTIGFMLNPFSACGLSDRSMGPSLNVQQLRELDWHIEVSLGTINDELRLKFTQSFVMPYDQIALRLPDTFLRKEKLYQRIEGLRVSDGELLNHKKFDYVKYIRHRQGERVTLSYFYRPDDPISYAAGKDSFSAPIIRRDYFQFVGMMAIIHPIALEASGSFPLTLKFQIPEKFQLFHSFGAQKLETQLTANFDMLRDAFFVAGRNMRLQKVDVRGQPVFITLEGTWDQIPDSQMVSVVTRVIDKQRETWKDDNFPYFLVNFLSEPSQCNGSIKFAGTAHTNSFRAYFPSGCEFKPEMKHLISHELMHMWIGKKIKVGKERGHIDGKWFTEGFTDYYGRLLAHRAGILSEDEYFNTLNSQLGKYYRSAERLVTLQSLIDRMYRRGLSNRALEDIPYQQGEIMAWRINKKIKIQSNFKYSLDNVIRDMLHEADKAGGTKNFNVFEINQIIDRYAGNALADDFRKVQQGELFEPPTLTECGQPKNYHNAYVYREIAGRRCGQWLLQ